MSELPLRGNLLLVDDTPANLRLLSSMLSEKDYKVRSVINGQMALMAVKTSPPDLILLDINMPDLNGYQVCERLKADPALADIPVIFISALDEIQDKVRAFAAGGVDYITKPFQLDEVLARVHTHLTLRRTQQELERTQAELWRTNQHLEERVQSQVRQIYALNQEIISALAELTESRDPATGQHLERVSRLCRVLAKQLQTYPRYYDQIDSMFLERLVTTSVLHDIGKVGIPDSILLKQGKLTPEEYNTMKAHALIGGEALRKLDHKYPGNPLIQMGIEITECHHERWNGQGYPRGLVGDAIPLSARILSLVDVYDALTSPRPYKPAFDHAHSREIIAGERGEQFDPDLVDCFLSIEDQFAAVGLHSVE